MADPVFGRNRQGGAGGAQAYTPAWALISLSGRINRSEYWWSQALLVSLALVALYVFVGDGVTVSQDGMILIDRSKRPAVYLVALLSSYTSLAVAVKRFHDLGLSGLFALVTVIPMLNVIAFVTLGLMAGEKGANRYGPAV